MRERLAQQAPLAARMRPGTLGEMVGQAHLLEEAGVPPGVVNVLPSSSSGAMVSAMLHDSRVRKLSFTGSTEVGRTLLREAADCVVDCSMVLGGNAPFIVFADADLEAALAEAMIAKMRNGGEACTAANRFYVEAPVADEFSRMLAGAMADLTVGPGLDPGVEVGPLVDSRDQGQGGRARRGRPRRRGRGPHRWSRTVPDRVLLRTDPSQPGGSRRPHLGRRGLRGRSRRWSRSRTSTR